MTETVAVRPLEQQSLSTSLQLLDLPAEVHSIILTHLCSLLYSPNTALQPGRSIKTDPPVSTILSLPPAIRFPPPGHVRERVWNGDTGRSLHLATNVERQLGSLLDFRGINKDPKAICNTKIESLIPLRPLINNPDKEPNEFQRTIPIPPFLVKASQVHVDLLSISRSCRYFAILAYPILRNVLLPLVELAGRKILVDSPVWPDSEDFENEDETITKTGNPFRYFYSSSSLPKIMNYWGERGEWAVWVWRFRENLREDVRMLGMMNFMIAAGPYRDSQP